MTPAPIRGQTYDLYALSGRATAFVGPLAVAWITYLTGSLRGGMSVILLLFAAGLALKWGVPNDKPGGQEAKSARGI